MSEKMSSIIVTISFYLWKRGKDFDKSSNEGILICLFIYCNKLLCRNIDASTN